MEADCLCGTSSVSKVDSPYQNQDLIFRGIYRGDQGLMHQPKMRSVGLLKLLPQIKCYLTLFFRDICFQETLIIYKGTQKPE
jgi:hypothetical protein